MITTGRSAWFPAQISRFLVGPTTLIMRFGFDNWRTRNSTIDFYFEMSSFTNITCIINHSKMEEGYPISKIRCLRHRLCWCGIGQIIPVTEVLGNTRQIFINLPRYFGWCVSIPFFRVSMGARNDLRCRNVVIYLDRNCRWGTNISSTIYW